MAYNITKTNPASTVKKVLFIVAIIVCLVIINVLARSIYDTWHKKDLVIQAKTNLARQKAENQQLKTQYSLVQKPEFVEKEARDKLFMIKPGEERVIVPDDLVKEKNEKVIVIRPNYQQWIDLILGK